MKDESPLEREYRYKAMLELIRLLDLDLEEIFKKAIVETVDYDALLENAGVK